MTTTDGRDSGTTGRRARSRRIFSVAAILAAQIVLTPAAAREPAGSSALPGLQSGVAVTPRGFPAHTPRDVDEAFALAAQVGNHAVFIFQWSELDPAIMRQVMEKSRAAGLAPVVGLSPTALAGGRKDLDLPVQVRLLAGPKISFANPVIRGAFRAAARELAALAPGYLCLATEINFLAMQRLDEYLHFASLYKEAYRDVKRISPGTQVFVSFQWEWMRILDAREPHRIAEHTKVIDIFRPELDAVGLTTYPAPFHATPESLPADYFTWVYRHIPRSEKVMLMETGWPTEGVGTEAEQVRFIERLPGLLRGMHVVGVEWALLHDVDHSAFDANLNTVGLLTGAGRAKPGLDAFRALRGARAIAPR